MSRRENPTDVWARTLRLNERETVVSTFLMVMEGEQFRHRHVDDAAQEIVDAVLEFYARIEGAVRPANSQASPQ